MSEREQLLRAAVELDDGALSFEAATPVVRLVVDPLIERATTMEAAAALRKAAEAA